MTIDFAILCEDVTPDGNPAMHDDPAWQRVAHPHMPGTGYHDLLRPRQRTHVSGNVHYTLHDNHPTVIDLTGAEKCGGPSARARYLRLRFERRFSTSRSYGRLAEIRVWGVHTHTDVVETRIAALASKPSPPTPPPSATSWRLDCAAAGHQAGQNPTPTRVNLNEWALWDASGAHRTDLAYAQRASPDTHLYPHTWARASLFNTAPTHLDEGSYGWTRTQFAYMSTLWDWPLTTGEISALKYYDENGDDLAFYEAGKWSDAAINAAGFAFIEFAPDTHAPYGTPSYFRLDNIVYGTQTVRYPTQYANTLAEAKRGEWQTPTGAQSRNPICNFGKAHYANNIWTGFGHASNVDATSADLNHKTLLTRADALSVDASNYMGPDPVPLHGDTAMTRCDLSDAQAGHRVYLLGDCADVAGLLTPGTRDNVTLQVDANSGGTTSVIYEFATNDTEVSKLEIDLDAVALIRDLRVYHTLSFTDSDGGWTPYVLRDEGVAGRGRELLGPEAPDLGRTVLLQGAQPVAALAWRVDFASATHQDTAHISGLRLYGATLTMTDADSLVTHVEIGFHVDTLVPTRWRLEAR
eukprot:gene30912-38751_t